MSQHKQTIVNHADDKLAKIVASDAATFSQQTNCCREDGPSRTSQGKRKDDLEGKDDTVLGEEKLGWTRRGKRQMKGWRERSEGCQTQRGQAMAGGTRWAD